MVNEHETISQAHYGNMLFHTTFPLEKGGLGIVQKEGILVSKARHDVFVSLFIFKAQLTTRW